MDKKYRIQNVETIPSPSLVVYLTQVQQNIERAIAIVDGDVSRLRPHAKTHKTAEIIAMERDAGILKHKCATLREAEMLAQNGHRGCANCLSDGGTECQPFCFTTAEVPGC